mmetsp:Transcript_10353/g.26040  ORF Transcript_10353/g.26040 Transcript_10353/m.26040 type:complete len:602 (-) Transcript_10353:45-1850(-)
MLNKMVVCKAQKSFLLLAVAWMTMPTSQASKQLVLIAGPRQEGIREFFHQHALEEKWSWPTLRDEDYELVVRESATWTHVSRHNVFDLLFEEETNSVIQQVLMESIRESWENSTHGIILGEERLANVGGSSFASNKNALKIIYRLMENLSIRAKDVTLVLIYDTPRIDQWASILHKESTRESYSDFLCQVDEDDKRSQYLDTIMNPFKLSKVYREHGWKVAVLDEQGVRGSGFDPAHAIACDILGVSCENGWVVGFGEETSRYIPSYEMNELEETEKDDLEELFLLRDCVHKQDLELEAEEFRVLHQQVVWQDCRNHYALGIREKMENVDFVLNAIQSQMGCGHDNSVQLSELLASANSTTSFDNMFFMIMCASIFFLAVVSGILFLRQETSFRVKFDGLFRNKLLWKRKPKNHIPSECPKALCNACRFVRFDPNCSFCCNRTQASSDMGKEIERRIKQHRAVNLVDATDETSDINKQELQLPKFNAPYSDAPPEEAFGRTSLAPSNTTADISQDFVGGNCIDISHFDINLRNTSSQSKTRRKKKEKECEQKSKAVRKMKSLLVAKRVDGKKIYSIAEPSSTSSTDNLQKKSFEEDNKVYV